jgi:hypothetical protein
MTKDDKYKNSGKGRVTQMLKSARRRARKNGRSFSLTREWVEEKLKAGVCEATGAKFSYHKKEKYKSAPFVPSLDRINSSRGYTPKNTQMVCNFYNICKWQWDKQDLKKIIKILKSVKI